MTSDLQHEQFLIAQARASGADWRPGQDYVHAALTYAADLAREDPRLAARAATLLVALTPFAWCRGAWPSLASQDETAPADVERAFAILLHAPDDATPRGVSPEERELSHGIARLLDGRGGWEVRAYSVDDAGELAPLEG